MCSTVTETYVCWFLFLLQDQDKLRPLSSLANLAITLSDIQDMDPIFTNLPYSTNVEEEAPLVSVNTFSRIELYLLPSLFLIQFQSVILDLKWLCFNPT